MRKIIILALAAFMFTACANKNKGYVDRAVKNLEASLDYPKQLKIIATSKADSAFKSGKTKCGDLQKPNVIKITKTKCIK